MPQSRTEPVVRALSRYLTRPTSQSQNALIGWATNPHYPIRTLSGRMTIGFSFCWQPKAFQSRSFPHLISASLYAHFLLHWQEEASRFPSSFLFCTSKMFISAHFPFLILMKNEMSPLLSMTIFSFCVPDSTPFCILQDFASSISHFSSMFGLFQVFQLRCVSAYILRSSFVSNPNLNSFLKTINNILISESREFFFSCYQSPWPIFRILQIFIVPTYSTMGCLFSILLQVCFRPTPPLHKPTLISPITYVLLLYCLGMIHKASKSP